MLHSEYGEGDMESRVKVEALLNEALERYGDDVVRIQEYLEQSTEFAGMKPEERLRLLSVTLEDCDYEVEESMDSLFDLYALDESLDADNPHVGLSRALAIMSRFRRDPEIPTEEGARALRPFFKTSDGVTLHVTEDRLQTFTLLTDEIELPLDERLRLLAVFLEEDTFVHGWQGLRKIYDTAARANPSSPWTYSSWGLSAIRWCQEAVEPDLDARMATATDGEVALLKALELMPLSAEAAYDLGILYYDHPARDTDPSILQKALSWFTRSLEWRPDNVQAQLFLAHCHHDRGDWERAIEAYIDVDQDELRAWQPWRAVKLREQIAACYAQIGSVEEAVGRFNALLSEIASLDAETAEDTVVNLDELVDTVTGVLSDEALLQRTRAAVVQRGLSERYGDRLQ